MGTYCASIPQAEYDELITNAPNGFWFTDDIPMSYSVSTASRRYDLETYTVTGNTAPVYCAFFLMLGTTPGYRTVENYSNFAAYNVLYASEESFYYIMNGQQYPAGRQTWNGKTFYTVNNFVENTSTNYKSFVPLDLLAESVTTSDAWGYIDNTTLMAKEMSYMMFEYRPTIYWNGNYSDMMHVKSGSGLVGHSDAYAWNGSSWVHMWRKNPGI